MSTDLQNQTVYLKETYFSPDGSSYHKGTYGPNELPKKAYQIPGLVVAEKSKETVQSLVRNKGNNVKEKEIRIDPYNRDKDPNKIEYLTKDRKKEITRIGPTSKIEAESKKIKENKTLSFSINTADKQSLIDLKGVGSVTAEKVIELRKEKPFTDYADLNKRVNLPLGKEWESFNVSFE